MPFLSRSLVALSLVAAGLATPLSTPPHYAPRLNAPLSPAPLVVEHHPHGSINNSYIVVFKDDVVPALRMNHLNFLETAHSEDPLPDGGVTHVYDGHINGYAGRFSSAVVNRIRSQPEVAFVEHDQVVRAYDIQTSAPWGLARISHRPRLSFGTFSKYEYAPEGGDGVDVYVIDTGINIGHQEFQNRASWGKTVPRDDTDTDENGHGTHCAGTIASGRYGVAKKANVIAVKVLGSNGSGSMSDVVSGVNWVAQDARKKASKAGHKGSVANMSLGGGKSQALDRLIDAAVTSGLHFAVAAGNDGKDACNFSPAGAEKAVTVAASTITDERAFFSNHGKCVDVFAPGLNIVSTYIGSKYAVKTLSGTSMASPHVAGLLAYLLSIYPSTTFNPRVDELDNVISLTQPQQTFAIHSSVYAVAYAALPQWIKTFLPAPILAEKIRSVAPVPGKTLTPAQLKQSLIMLSSKDLLTNLPKETVNLLVFNNFTRTS